MIQDPQPGKDSFSVASYNVLATAYVHPARYPRTSSLVLNPAWRVPALVGHVASLGDDIICLQEVEIEVFSALRIRLGSLGYGSQYARKQSGKPDGCATFYRHDVFDLVDANIISYADGHGVESDSGNIALVAVLSGSGDIIGIINTHLTWAPPNLPLDAQLSYRQINQLLREYKEMESKIQCGVIAGDFNITPDSATIALVSNAGLDFSHRGLPGVYTCNANARARMIDYLFYSSTLQAEALPLPVIDDRTVLPSAEQPSDHVPVRAKFRRKD
jgi:mRNA deadenylase 3'-5' endonuclease subunit Ccr4